MRRRSPQRRTAKPISAVHCVLGAWHMCTELQGRVGARDALNQLTEISHRSYVYPTRFAIAYLGLDKDRALTLLERAHDG